jgi:hypothetical protein
MRSTLDEVLAALDDLETYVQSIDPVNAALAGISDPTIRGYLTVRRQLDGAAFIVVLYAAFEKFVEDLVWSHTEFESAAVEYQRLSDRLRKKHLEQSANLLAKGRLGEGRYANLTAADAIAILHECVSGVRPYKLNRHAVLYHENNLRPTIVKEIFSLTGVSDINEMVRETASLVRWNLELTSVPGPVALSSIERRLDDIVERRNQTTHTGVRSGQVLGSAEMQEHVEFMRAYCKALYEVVVGAYLDRFYAGDPAKSTPLGKFILGPLSKNGGAVVVGKPACRIYIGQPVIGKHGKRVDRWGTVQELRVDDKPVQAVEAGDPTAQVGLRVDFEFTGSAQLYLLSAKDQAVWK